MALDTYQGQEELVRGCPRGDGQGNLPDYRCGETFVSEEQHNKDEAPASEEEADYQLDFPEYMSDDFRVNSFKVVPCSKRCSHDWTTCPFAHPGEKARRRDPKQCKYAAIACIDMKNTGVCPRGEDCPYAHNVFEYWMHPTRYRTQICNDGTKCKRKICFFAHKIEELRVPPHKPGFPTDWHKGKKHGRSRSSGSASAKSSKNIDSPKSRPKSLRTLSVPVDVPSANPSGDGDLFKSKSFSSGQFPLPHNLMPRRSVDGIMEHMSGMRLSETWDLEPNMPTRPMGEPPGYPSSQPISSHWSGHPLQRRSMDSQQMEPSIPENTVPILPPHQPANSDANVSYLLHHILQQAGLGDPIAASIPPTQLDMTGYRGHMQDPEEAVQRASFDSTLSAQTVQGCGVGNTPLPYPMSQDGTPVLDTGMACTQWPGEYSPYPMMASETDLVNQIGLMSLSGNVGGLEADNAVAAYAAGYKAKDAQSGVHLAY